MWGQQTLVDNRGGAQGSIGTAAAARLPGDGYSTLLACAGTPAIHPHESRQRCFDARGDFTAITPATWA